MRATVNAESLVLIEDVAVVFDDVSRIRWRRTTTGWILRDPWPDIEERRALQTHLDNGGTSLVITTDEPIRVEALANELPTSPPDGQNAADPVEVCVDHYDWLPYETRRRGETFAAEQKERWTAHPSLLRPPVTFDSADPSADLRLPGHVMFALIAPGTTKSRVERDLAQCLSYLRSRPTPDRRALLS
ncbi:hypothetical protein [Curtobacterium sp. MCBD17_008]|uniref:hypothetical protein n=1 Tax=Curtobacterium sp. MCBD17_008 TaxID=2175656 RepID=UPI0011B64CD3|nr:hypothetical protein [Curtobacterium sp. MCBD17_008]